MIAAEEEDGRFPASGRPSVRLRCGLVRLAARGAAGADGCGGDQGRAKGGESAHSQVASAARPPAPEGRLLLVVFFPP